MFSRASLRPWKPVSLSCPELAKLVHLREFYGSTLLPTPETIMVLSTLPHLQTINFQVDPAVLDWGTLPDPKDGRAFFNSLTTLSVSGNSCEWLIAFLPLITSTTLRELSFFQGYSYPWAMESNEPRVPNTLFQLLCTAIGQHPSWQHTIEKVSIDIVTPDTQNSNPGDVYTSQHIAPLLSLTALRWLYILTKPRRIILDDAMLRSIAFAWPRIEELRLDAHPLDGRWQEALVQPGEFPVATLAGVLLLARHCRSLAVLLLAVDMRKIPDVGALARPPVPLEPGREHPLVVFNPQGSVFSFHVGEATALASFLSLVFPRLFSGAGYKGPVWDEAITRAWEFQSIRAQERRWALENGKRESGCSNDE
ncbi:hypothetical protein C2E23DRAFT_950804 [Lenzites betulinus]|nr:hypothetical protein C2E23DRAFT_950804 [Lenzites betulinus]